MSDPFGTELFRCLESLTDFRIPYNIIESKNGICVEYQDPQDETPGRTTGYVFDSKTHHFLAEYTREEKEHPMIMKTGESEITIATFEFDGDLIGSPDPEVLESMEEYFLGLIDTNVEPDDDDDDDTGGTGE